MDVQKYRALAAQIDPAYAELDGAMSAIADCLVNSAVNVTAIKDDDGILSLHIIDSLYAAKEIASLSPATVCDVGSGGGFPALPIAAALPNVQVTAIDSTAKKCRYIEETAAASGIKNISTRSVRAEEAVDLFGTFDAVCARAVAALPVLCEICSPLIKEGGYFVAMKGEKADAEIAEAARAAKVLGLNLLRVVPYTLPVGGDHRSLAVFQKTAPTPKGYPREYRKIVKKPL